MTYEEMERSMDFILQQLGRFAASVQRSTDSILEQQAKNTSDIAQLAVLGRKLFKNQLRTDKQLAETDKQLAETNKQLAETNKQLAETNKQIEQLAEAQKKTEQTLNAFVSAIGRRFSGNGRGRKSS
jgi:septal ring factor EnvC (AmiA/AmiB activator)